MRWFGRDSSKEPFNAEKFQMPERRKEVEPSDPLYFKDTPFEIREEHGRPLYTMNGREIDSIITAGGTLLNSSLFSYYRDKQLTGRLEPIVLSNGSPTGTFKAFITVVRGEDANAYDDILFAQEKLSHRQSESPQPPVEIGPYETVKIAEPESFPPFHGVVLEEYRLKDPLVTTQHWTLVNPTTGQRIEDPKDPGEPIQLRYVLFTNPKGISIQRSEFNPEDEGVIYGEGITVDIISTFIRDFGVGNLYTGKITASYRDGKRII